MRQSAMAPEKEQFRAVTAVATLQLVIECGGAQPHVLADAIIANGNVHMCLLLLDDLD